MNERIRELMGKTLDDKFSHTWDTMSYEGLLQFSEKFAELIVAECASQVRFTDLLKCNDDSDGEILLQASVQLKQHFGVEE